MSTPLASTRPAAVGFILVTVFVDVLAFGIIIPVLPHLLKQFAGGDLADAALWHGLFATGFMVMQFLASPVQGALSDHFGRRPVILASNFGLAVDFVIMALAPSLPWLLLGRLLAGATSASFSTANAYIADVTPPDQRARAFAKIGIAFGLGFTLSPALGALLGEWHLRAPFIVAATLALANAVYGLRVLPESLPVERRVPFDWRRANPVGALTLLRSHPGLLGLAGVSFLLALAHLVYPSTFVLYADLRYGWGLREVGFTLLGVGVMGILVQGVIVGQAVRRLGERRTVFLGLGLGAVGFTLFALAETGVAFWMAMPIAALWAIANPANQALMSQQAGPQEQGRLQGAIASLAAIAGILGPLIFTHVLAVAAAQPHRGPWDGATFALSAGFLILAGGLAALTFRRQRAAMATGAQ